MTIFKRRRLFFWLIKAYFKKSGHIIALSFFFGLIVFFVIVSSSKFLLRLLPTSKKMTIGMIGAYTSDTLPPLIAAKLSRGLTKIAADGSVIPDIAESWKITESGKVYEFYLKKDILFNDGKPLVSDDITYNFSGVTVNRPNKFSIVYRLQDSYSPFLVTVSRPIFKKNFIGVGEYKVDNAEVNGNFIQSLRIISNKDKFISDTYQFYRDQETLKTAFAMGEVSKAVGLTDTFLQKQSFAAFPQVKIRKTTDYSKLVTLFFNTRDASLSDKKLRNGLAYALPDRFPMGKRVFLPYSPQFIYFDNKLPDKKQDLAHSNLLLNPVKESNKGNIPELVIKVLEKYKSTAVIIAKEWEKVGIKAKIETVSTVPQEFQIYLGEFTLPKDPDQYALWHSRQQNNITNYESKRIDKLLEDGRRETDFQKREEIYSSFQKYLLDDSPAAFLYFPYEYSVSRH